MIDKQWDNVNDQSNTNYDVRIEIIFNTEVLKSNLSDFNDAYILVRRDIVSTQHNNPMPIALKNCASFIKCITKIDEITIDDAEDLDLVMAMCNPIEHSSTYSETTECLWIYSKYEAPSFNGDIANNNNFKSFQYKDKLYQKTKAVGANGILRIAALAVLLKHISNL